MDPYVRRNSSPANYPTGRGVSDVFLRLHHSLTEPYMNPSDGIVWSWQLWFTRWYSFLRVRHRKRNAGGIASGPNLSRTTANDILLLESIGSFAHHSGHTWQTAHIEEVSFQACSPTSCSQKCTQTRRWQLDITKIISLRITITDRAMAKTDTSGVRPSFESWRRTGKFSIRVVLIPLTATHNNGLINSQTCNIINRFIYTETATPQPSYSG